MLLDLQAGCRKSFLASVVRQSLETSPGESFLLILDGHTRRMVDLVVGAEELTALGVYGVEQVEQPRNPFPNLNGLYFLEPTSANVSLVQLDFEPRRKYRSQHLFFSRPLPEQTLHDIALRPFAKALRALKEFLFDYYPLGRRLFVLPGPTEGQSSRVDSLASLLVSQGAVGSVELRSVNGPSFARSAAFAKSLAGRLSSLLHSLPAPKQPTTVKLFIFERPVDIVSPLVHSLFYEPLVADLLRGSVEVFPGGDGPRPAARIARDDAVYQKFRLSQFGRVMSELRRDFDEFTAGSEAAKLARTDESQVTANGLKRVLGEAAVFSRTMAHYGLHSDNVKSILAEIEGRDLQRLSNFEITIATGVNSQSDTLDLKKKKELTMDFIKGGKGSADDKLRLALIAAGSLYKDITALPDAFDQASRDTIVKFRELVKRHGKLIGKAEKGGYRELVVRKAERFGDQSARYLSRAEYLLTRHFEQGVLGDFTTETVGAEKTVVPGSRALSLFRGRAGSGRREAVVVYFMEGISVNEVCDLERYLATLKLESGYVVGGDALWGPKDFVEQFVNRGL